MDPLTKVDFEAITQTVVEAARAPVEMFLAPDSMFFWPYLVSALAIAFGVYLSRVPAWRRSPVTLLKRIFNRRIWFARSTMADLRYGLVNTFVFPILIAPLGMSGLLVGFAIEDYLKLLVGPPPEALFNTAMLTFLYTVVVYLSLELGHYIAHYAMHRVPALWAFHRVHHSAEVLTPLTNLRHHPFDLLILGSMENLFAGVATGVFLYLGDGSVTHHTVIGVHVATFGYRLFGNLQHSQVWLSFGVLDRLIMSPALHQLHHSALPEHRDRNYGLALSVWDWAFGTLHAPARQPRFAMGLGDGTDGRLHSVGKMYFEPFLYLIRAWSKPGT